MWRYIEILSKKNCSFFQKSSRIFRKIYAVMLLTVKGQAMDSDDSSTSRFRRMEYYFRSSRDGVSKAKGKIFSFIEQS